MIDVHTLLMKLETFKHIMLNIDQRVLYDLVSDCLLDDVETDLSMHFTSMNCG